MASSTADIVAVIRCLAKLHGMPPSDELIREILRRIERSDPIFHNYHSVYFSGFNGSTDGSRLGSGSTPPGASEIRIPILNAVTGTCFW